MIMVEVETHSEVMSENKLIGSYTEIHSIHILVKVRIK